MEKLPDEIVEHIINYGIKCKKDQNVYVNKRFLKISKKKIDNCSKTIVLNHPVCIGCHPQVLTFFKGYFSIFY